MANDNTRITLKSDKATGITEFPSEADIQGVGFNLGYIAAKDPTLVVDILKDYERAKKITKDSPAHPDEDYSLAFEEVKKLFNRPAEQ